MLCQDLSADLFECMDTHGGLFDTYIAPSIFSEDNSCPFHLSISCISPKLGNDLTDLRQSRCADGMPAALENAAGIYRFFAKAVWIVLSRLMMICQARP